MLPIFFLLQNVTDNPGSFHFLLRLTRDSFLGRGFLQESDYCSNRHVVAGRAQQSRQCVRPGCERWEFGSFPPPPVDLILLMSAHN